MKEADYWAQVDVPRNVWDPTEGHHSRHGERDWSEIVALELHYPGSGNNIEDHFDSADELLSFEAYHEKTKGWYDLFYNVALDTELFTYEGRDATIPSQRSLRDTLTLLLLVDVDTTLSKTEYDGMGLRVWQLWGAVDPARQSSTLGYHGERASTSCPGATVIGMVRMLREGWVPPGAIETRGGPMYLQTNTTTGVSEVHTRKGWCTPTSATHWRKVVKEGQATGEFKSPYFDQLDALIWQQAGGDDPPAPAVDVAAIAKAVNDDASRRMAR